ncbi:hypothetical protein NYO91_11855 [Arhodomonas aquaeolei]|uniref:hypothetical protein n=2 Tax=Ectothiorhodospiraceae TaxID=72276 RepID=UPI002169385F|nr:hypothetical protein [Arhodomonas aquaeolei]MCS4504771.1 hypothetical protein [Arhodomonas aquaeolei]
MARHVSSVFVVALILGIGAAQAAPAGGEAAARGGYLSPQDVRNAGEQPSAGVAAHFRGPRSARMDPLVSSGQLSEQDLSGMDMDRRMTAGVTRRPSQRPMMRPLGGRITEYDFDRPRPGSRV